MMYVQARMPLVFVVAFIVWQSVHMMVPISGINASMVSWFLCLAGPWVWVLNRFGFRPVISAAVLLSLYGMLHMMFHSDFTMRAPDWWGHTAYINHVLHHWTVPAPHAGWEYYQQPVYYFIAAAFKKLLLMMDVRPMIFMRSISLPCVLAFQLYGLRIIRRMVASPRIALICSLLLVLWPFYLEIGGRINNDLLLYPLWAVCYYYLLRWYQERKERDIAIALYICAVTFLVKTSAILPAATIVITVWYATRKPFGGFQAGKGVGPAAFAVYIAATLNFGRSLYYKFTTDPDMALIIGNMHRNRYLKMLTSSNEWQKFLTLDVRILLTSPYVDYVHDTSGRHYYWHNYLKSLLFGYDRWPFGRLAIIMNLILLAWVFYVVLASLLVKLSRQQWVLVMGIVLVLVAQVILRLFTQDLGTMDARITFPSMILFITYAGTLLESLRLQGWRYTANVGVVLTGSFLFLSSAWLLMIISD